MDRTLDSCGIRNRLDFVFFSGRLLPFFNGGEISAWVSGDQDYPTHRLGDLPEIENGDNQASGHAAVFIDFNV